MLAARGQAELYARALPLDEGWPPFLIVVDVGYSFELYADFSRSGKTYIPFPDPRSHRLLLHELEREEIRERLRRLWTDPLSLDPARRAARVTREVARHLAVLARSLEESGHAPERVAAFLMRAIFTMFAEDVHLIPEGSFTELLDDSRQNGEEGLQLFPDLVRSLWETMNTGGVSPVLRKSLLRFNGGLFESCEALPLTRDQLDLLIIACHSDWRDVEPAIFGTLLERALDPVERHKLGAHYTPRAYVERLVMPTVIEPLREEWATVQAAAVTAQREGSEAGAREILSKFHDDLCTVKVLDPACGSGNFLYVTLEHLKRLEGEVLNALDALGQLSLDLEKLQIKAVDPHQLLGIEVNPRAAAITDLVLWIGHLQWHFRTRGETLPAEPVIKKFHNIECRDAVLAYDGTEPLRDAEGKPVTRWDGRTFKKHPVTGQDVPDETARVPVLRYLNPRKAEWPKADYVVGNPPFVGNKRMRLVLGDGYVEALRDSWPEVPDACDYVMYWWEHAAALCAAVRAKRFGLIATNSLVQVYNRQVLRRHLGALALSFAIADHPWVDSADGAAVRISMSVALKAPSPFRGSVSRVVSEREGTEGQIEVGLVAQHGVIDESLRVGTDRGTLTPLRANSRLGFRGVTLVGDGFLLSPDDPLAQSGPVSVLVGAQSLIGRASPRLAIDLFGLTEDQALARYPNHYQHLLNTVRDAHAARRRPDYASKWWLFARPRGDLRQALERLPQFLCTVETSKYRWFTEVSTDNLPEQTLVAIALSDPLYLGVLSSRAHTSWSLSVGGTLEDRPRYTIAQCFDPFPFPDASGEQKSHIRELGETLDAHRKRQQALHPKLTITEMYNVLEKLRSGEPLTEREKRIHEEGLVSVLKQLHDDLDAAVFAAYGWPAELTDEEILERLVALNAERAAEERRGLVRWLRPEFQNPAGGGQTALETGDEAAPPAAAVPTERRAWPRSLPEQARAVRAALAAHGAPATPGLLARAFKGARTDRVAALLETLASLGQARLVEPGKYAV